MKKKVILAFSGGLDTSYCVKYLGEEKGYEVHTITVNTGGFDDSEIKEIESKAKDLGVASHKTVDETKNYYDPSLKKEEVAVEKRTVPCFPNFSNFKPTPCQRKLSLALAADWTPRIA